MVIVKVGYVGTNEFRFVKDVSSSSLSFVVHEGPDPPPCPDAPSVIIVCGFRPFLNHWDTCLETKSRLTVLVDIVKSDLNSVLMTLV